MRALELVSAPLSLSTLSLPTSLSGESQPFVARASRGELSAVPRSSVCGTSTKGPPPPPLRRLPPPPTPGEP